MKRWSLMLASCCVMPIAVLAQAPGATESRPSTHDGAAPPAAVPVVTFRSGIDLVALNVVVTDGKDRFVTGLSRADFAVFEDGIEQEVTFFGASTVPLDLAILFDSSASMSDKIGTAQLAAVGFLSVLRAGDRVTIIDVKDASTIAFPLGEDVTAARGAILSTKAKGSTALYNATYLALREMAKVRRGTGAVRRQAIVVLSDGDDTSSLVSYDDVLALAKESAIAIYTISLRSPADVLRASAASHPSFSQSAFALKALARETGAKAYFPSAIAELAGVYSSIAEELSNQYALGYSSTNPGKDGSYRHVIVRVTGMQTRTRNGYLSARMR